MKLPVGYGNGYRSVWKPGHPVWASKKLLWNGVFFASRIHFTFRRRIAKNLQELLLLQIWQVNFLVSSSNWVNVCCNVIQNIFIYLFSISNRLFSIVARLPILYLITENIRATLFLKITQISAAQNIPLNLTKIRGYMYRNISQQKFFF